MFAQGSVSVDVSPGESRRIKQERILDDLRIPEDQVKVREDRLLGKGGFGVVYLADYNGGDAAAKVFKFEHEIGSTPGRDGDGDRTTGGELMCGGGREVRRGRGGGASPGTAVAHGPEGFRSRESVSSTSWEKSELTACAVGLTESISGRASSVS